MKFAVDLFPNIDELPTRQKGSFPEIEDQVFWEMYDRCKPYSLLHVTGFFNLYQSMNYLSRNKMGGSAVECGCFLGGAAAFIGLMREHLSLDLEIWLFDTFEGPPIGETDVFVGGTLIETPAKLPNYRKQVQRMLSDVVGSTKRYRFVVGLVEDTISQADVENIALLRLDTDFYSSTKIEMDVLYPRLQTGGVLIVDDYGTFQGSRKAVDEYLSALRVPPLLNRIDIGIFAGVKPPDLAAELDGRPIDTKKVKRGWLGRS